MPRQDWIGLRVARWRDIAGMTQQELADAVGVSRPYIAMIEGGQRAVTKRSLVIELASALGVSITDLTGQPGKPRTADDMALYAAVPRLRGALDDDPEDTTAPIDVPALTSTVDQAMRARMACDYQTLARLLPEAVAETRRLANDGSETGLALFVRAAATAALGIKPFGHIDLSTRLAERAMLAADLLGRPVEQAAARFTAAQCALGAGTVGGRRRSLATAAKAAAELGDDGDDQVLTWYGMLHLHAALSAATLNRADDAASHLAEAEATAARVKSDPWRMEFTTANVGIWRAGVALENGEPERAPEYARQVDRSQVRTANRRARLHIDAGRGYYAAGNQEAAIRQFLAADEVSAAELRGRPTVTEIVGQMVRDTRRRGSAELRELAARIGIDPLDPDRNQT